MVEVTEAMKRLGITQEVLQRWQEEAEDGIDDPAPWQTRGDTLILAQRRAEAEARREANGARNGNGHGVAETDVAERGVPERAADAAVSAGP